MAVNTVTELPENQVIHVVENVPLQEEDKITIIENGDLGYDSKRKIAEQLEDEEIRGKVYQELYDGEERRALERLEELYDSCNEEMSEVVFEQQLRKIMEDVLIESDLVQEKINKIVARKIAYNYAVIGTTIVSKLRFVMLPKEMVERNIVQVVKEEHKKILKERKGINGKSIKPFDEKQIEELNKNIDIELESTANMNDDDKEYSEEIAFKEFRRNMGRFRYNARKVIMKKLNSIIQNDKKMQAYKDIEDAGLAQRLADLPDEQRKKVIETFMEALDKRQVAKNQTQATEWNGKETSVTDNSDISGTPSEGR